MNLNSKQSLISRLRRGKEARHRFVESHLAKNVAHQIRAIRDKLGWSQERLAKESNMNQNAISRLESTEYGKPTLTTLKRLAAAMDVALVIRFVPFSELVDWVSGTPRTIEGLGTNSLAVSCFDREEKDHVFDEKERVVAAFNEKESNTSSSRTVKSSYDAIQNYSRNAALQVTSALLWGRRPDEDALAMLPIGWLEAYLSGGRALVGEDFPRTQVATDPLKSFNPSIDDENQYRETKQVN